MFTSDQTRNFYVVTKALVAGSIGANDPAGTLLLKGNTTEHAPYEPFIAFQYKTPNGNGGDLTVRTDLVPLGNIEYVSVKDAVRRNRRRLAVTFNSGINGGAPVAGQKYSLAISFRGSQIMRERGFTKYLEGVVAGASTTAADIMTSFEASLGALITAQKLPIKVTRSTATLTIEEVERPFRLGQTNTRPIDFDISSQMSGAGGEGAWASVANTTSTNTANYQINGPEIANMEWFYIGERAPHGRLGNNDDRFFRLNYLASPAKEYDTVDISYFYKGNNEDIQHSRKVISLAVDTDSMVTAADLAAAIDALRFPVPDSGE